MEVFNVADQKWIPVDPLILKIVDKPSKYEPPANDAENSMSYVVAIDEDGYVKDVTRRYTHAYNAKTRLNRVESTKDGYEWWQRIMRVFRDPLPQDRDQVEDSELAGKEAREPMPRNIVEFKNHPHYALERHLRQNEVLHPKRQVGTISSGSNKSIEAVYRRNDVHTVRSADAWFRKGQQVKLNEMPLKYLEAKKTQGQRTRDDEMDDEGAEIPGIHAGTPLFAAYQTEQYTPPPVLNGIIPKNIYGNIDVYTAWMVPAGGVWINHPFAGGAAKLLSLDWADAVTGFEFRGRTGTAIIKGVVVAGEYHEAVVETIKALQYAIEEEELHNRSMLVLQMWKRFLIALRIRERIKSYHVEGEELEEAAAKQQSGSEYTDDNASDNGETSGGFLHTAHEAQSDTDTPMPTATPHETQQDAETLPKALQDAMAPILSTWGEPLPTIINNPIPPFQNHNVPDEYTDTSGGFFLDNTTFPDHASGFIIPDPSEVGEGGGFLPDPELDTGEGSGGFIPAIPATPATPEPELELKLQSKPDQSQSQKKKQKHEPHNHKTPREEQQQQEEENPKHQASRPHITTTTKTHNNEEPTQQQQQQESSKSAILTHTESTLSSKTTTTTTSSSNKSASAAGSLLSHDPDDDDVEPEWI